MPIISFRNWTALKFAWLACSMTVGGVARTAGKAIGLSVGWGRFVFVGIGVVVFVLIGTGEVVEVAFWITAVVAGISVMTGAAWL